MLDWCPSQSSGAFKKWRNTSKSKSSKVAVTNPLEEFRSEAKKMLHTDMAKRLQVSFVGNTPPQEDLLVLLGMWVLSVVKGEGDIWDILEERAPYMREESRERWVEAYRTMNITVKGA